MPAPEDFTFRLSPDQRQLAIYDPVNGPWFIPESGMQGRFVNSDSMDSKGRTQHEAESVAQELREQLGEARMWARHGYELGQRSGTWSDFGVAPEWLTNDVAPQAKQQALVAELLGIIAQTPGVWTAHRVVSAFHEKGIGGTAEWARELLDTAERTAPELLFPVDGQTGTYSTGGGSHD